MTTKSAAYLIATHFELLEHGSLTNHELADCLEHGRGEALPDWLQDYLIRHLRGEVKRKRGRQQGGVVREFAVVEAARRYEQLLREYQEDTRSEKADTRSKKKVASADRKSPQELAARGVLDAMPKSFRTMDWRALLNRISQYNRDMAGVEKPSRKPSSGRAQ